MDNIKEAQRPLYLIRLQVADHVPRNAADVVQLGPLVRRLLHAVFADVGDAGRCGFAHGGGAEPLAHRDQRHFLGRTATSLAGCGDAVAHLRQPRGYRLPVSCGSVGHTPKYTG